MTIRSLPGLFSILIALAPTALLVPIHYFALVVVGVLALAILRERLHEHHMRVAGSRASAAENLLRLECAEAARDRLARQIQREAA